MHETPPAAPPADRRTDGRTGVSRRAVLVAGGVTVVAAAGGGTAVAALQPLEPTGRAQPPAELSAALAAETWLLTVIDASLAADPSLRTALAPVRADHAAHAAALRAAVAEYPAAPSAGRPGSPAARPLGRAALQAAERLAAGAAARRAAVLRGRNATLLASISACEASHAEFLA